MNMNMNNTPHYTLTTDETPESEESSSLTNTTRSTQMTTLLFLFLLLCMIVASLWCVFAVRNYRSERVHPIDETAQTPTGEPLSLEKIYENVMSLFDKLGNKTVRIERSFVVAWFFTPPDRHFYGHLTVVIFLVLLHRY